MCVSVNPFEGFTPSTILNAELDDGRRLLTYQNGIRPQGSNPGTRFPGGDFLGSGLATSNAMVLHVPTDADDIEVLPATHTQLNALSHTLAGIALPQLSTVYRSGMLGMRGGGLRGGGPAVVSQGAYDIAVASPSMESVTEAFEAIRDVNSRFTPPKMSPELVEFYKGLYPEVGGVSLILAGFNPNRGMESHPIAISYAQKGTDIFMPGLEEHSGEVPAVGEPGKRDFRVMVSPLVAFSEAGGFSINPDTVVGFHEKRADGPNEDYAIDERDLEGILARADRLKSGIDMYRLSSALAKGHRNDWVAQFEDLDDPDVRTHTVEQSTDSFYGGSHIHEIILP